MSHPFDTLTPDLVLDAIESQDLLSDARVLALNSYCLLYTSPSPRD